LAGFVLLSPRRQVAKNAKERQMTEDEIGRLVVDVAVHVHRNLGAGLLETVYEVVLAHELRRRSLQVKRQVPIPLTYEGIKFDEAFRMDLIVEDKVFVS
jgi:GxxExxY protein